MAKVLDGMTIVNGPAFTADGSRMYVTDTYAGLIYACDVDPRSGELSGRRVFAEVPSSDGSPDGMTVDDAGRVWVALWDGSAVRCYLPDGTVAATVPCRPGGRPAYARAAARCSCPRTGSGSPIRRPPTAPSCTRGPARPRRPPPRSGWHKTPPRPVGRIYTKKINY